MPPMSRRLTRFGASPIIEIAKLAGQMSAAGHQVLDLSSGEPDFATEAFICEAGKTAIDQGRTRYTASDGMSELKAAVARKFAREGHTDYALSQIAVGDGAKPLLGNIAMALLDDGDEVVIPAPCWPSHPGLGLSLGAQPVFVHAGADQGFRITPEQLRAALTPRTRALILCNPGNPTGGVYSADDQKALAQVLTDFPDVWIIADEIYSDIIFDGAGHTSFAVAAPELADRTITVNGMSKGYSMTGWRIGYAAGPVKIMDGLRQIMSQVTSSPPMMSQIAAIAALDGPQQGVATRNAAYQARRDLVLAEFSGIPQFQTPVPGGAFYLFVDCSGVIGQKTPAGVTLRDSRDFATYLLEQALVAVVPGEAFEAPNTFRLSIASSTETLKAACAAILTACEALT